MLVYISYVNAVAKACLFTAVFSQLTIFTADCLSNPIQIYSGYRNHMGVAHSYCYELLALVHNFTTSRVEERRVVLPVHLGSLCPSQRHPPWGTKCWQPFQQFVLAFDDGDVTGYDDEGLMNGLKSFALPWLYLRGSKNVEGGGDAAICYWAGIYLPNTK